MSKVTVWQFLNAGFEFVAGDVVDAGCGNHEVLNGDVWNKPSHKDLSSFVVSLVPRKNTGTQPVTDDCVIEVVLRDDDNGKALASTIDWSISKTEKNRGDVITWKPSLKHLEQQMNKQESTMNISERDIENAIDNVEVERVLAESDEWVNGLPPVGSVCEIKHQRATSEWANPDFYEAKILAYGNELMIIESHGRESCGDICDYIFRKPLTPEQLEAKERDDSVDTMLIDAGFRGNVNVNEFRLNNLDSDLNVVFDSMFNLYDAGYRK